MKATLEFNLPDESGEHYAAIHGADYRNVIWELNQWLRNEIKYSGRSEFAEVRAHLEVLMADAGLEE